jgi:putative heme-binding domain-containing protein
MDLKTAAKNRSLSFHVSVCRSPLFLTEAELIMWSLIFFTARVAAATAFAAPIFADEPSFGLEKRLPWTTSNFRGRPEPPPPYMAARIYPNLQFNKTTFLAIQPGNDRFFVGERDGKLLSLPTDRQSAKADLFFDAVQLVDRLNQSGEPPVAFESLYGFAFDPDFEQNRFCYVCYVVRYRERGSGQHPQGTRVSRFHVSHNEPPICEIDSEQLIISWLQGGHNGGCLKFGPDGCLFISSGDGGSAFPPDGLKSGQDLSTLLAKILRIDVRRSENGQPYSIPADNPFVAFAGARGETWAYGLRNPWKMSFDRRTGALWVGDVGWELWELVYRVNKGDNFGWSIVEGSQTVHAERPRGPTPIVPPIVEIPHTEGASITGGFVYRGQKLPELEGTYIFGDWETRRVWGMKVDGGKVGERYELIDPTVRIVDFAEDSRGELYLLDHDDGSIYTLTRNTAATDTSAFPRRLGDTGLFQSVARHEPASGVIPFSINCEQWSDHATAERLLGVPGNDTIQVRADAKSVPGSQFRRATEYPRDTVLLKTLSLELTRGDPTSRRRIETQALHYDGREWHGYSYEWNDDQTDAVLVERSGKNHAIQIADPQAPGGRRTQTWRFSSRDECLRCHNPWSEYTLAFNLAQLNRQHDFGGISDNQIRTLRHIGVLTDVEDDPKRKDRVIRAESPHRLESLPKLVPPFGTEGDINDRARSYLHVNCAHCHRFNGGGSSYIFLQRELALADMKAIGMRPTQGTFGIHDAQLLAPGDPYRSVLYYRLAKIGPGHMPHLGATIVDDRALAIIHDWIRQLPVMNDDATKIDRLIAIGDSSAAPRSEERQKLTGELLSSPSKALLIADAIRQNRLPGAARTIIMEVALRSTTDPAIRDLFEAFIPEEQRTRRLGETINTAEILNLAGDAARGRQLFHESTVLQCRSCHRIAQQGTDVGPDLDAIGKKYDRAKLLESIVQPSLQIDPKYTLWLVETKRGEVHSGLLVERDATVVVLKDAQNKLHRIATDEVERMVAQTKSPMPDLLLRDFTSQQAADLLAYLSSLKDGGSAGRP